MAGLEGIASAFQSGWQSATDAVNRRQERREQLEDEERRTRVATLYDQAHKLALRVPSLTGADRDQAMSQLADIEEGIKLIYHPDRNPGAVQKDWNFLADMIRRKPRPQPVNITSYDPTTTPASTFTPDAQSVTLPETPAYLRRGEAPSAGDPGTPASQSITLPSAPVTIPGSRVNVRPAPEIMSRQQRERMTRRDEARRRAALDVAAGGLSPEQEAAIDVRKTDAEIEAKMMRFDKYYPDAPKDIRDRYRMSLLEASSGIKIPVGGTKWVTKSGSIGDQKVAVMYDEKDPDAKLRYLNGQPVPDDLAGKFVPDATRAGQQGLKFDKVTGQVLDPTNGKRYNEGDPANPPEVKDMFAGMRATLADTRQFQQQLATLRASTYNDTRPISSLDTVNGNAPVMVPFSAYRQNPGRYLPATEADKVIPKENLMQDIAGTSQLTRQAIVNLKEDFGEDMKAKIALAGSAEDPGQYFRQLFASGALASLPDDQRQFMIATQQLAENAMAMRSILGAGQGSEDVRNAIRATLPSLLSPDRAYALAQLDAFDKTIARLHRGVPRVPLNQTPFNVQSPEGGGTTAAGKGPMSIAAAMKMWADKGQPKTEPWVIRDLQKRGYTPMRP